MAEPNGPAAWDQARASPFSGWPGTQGREAGWLLNSRGHKGKAFPGFADCVTSLGRLHRDVSRRSAGNPALEAAFKTVPERKALILDQTPQDPSKLHALHAPEGMCIGKG